MSDYLEAVVRVKFVGMVGAGMEADENMFRFS